MSVSYKEFPDTKTVELTVNGSVSLEDYEAVVGPMQSFIDTHGTVKMLEIVESFPKFDPAMLIPGIKFDIRNLRHISHVAVVSDIGWLSPLVRAAGAVISTQLKVFALADVDKARAWLDEATV